MTRPLGSFNRRVNLPQHHEDFQPQRLPRIARLRPEVIPGDRGRIETGGEKFVAGRGRSAEHRENRRFAGDVMNIDLRVGQSMPYENLQDLNYGAPGSVGQMYTVRSGEVVERANEDLSKRILMSNQTGQNIKISYGMQSAFAPPLAGAAESRTTQAVSELPDLYYYR